MPCAPCTSMPRRTSAAHTASCVVPGFDPATTTSAPASANSVARYAVFASRWTTTATRRPRNEPSPSRSRASRLSTGEWRATHWIRRSPSGHSDSSAMRELTRGTLQVSLFAELTAEAAQVPRLEVLPADAPHAVATAEETHVSSPSVERRLPAIAHEPAPVSLGVGRNRSRKVQRCVQQPPVPPTPDLERVRRLRVPHRPPEARVAGVELLGAVVVNVAQRVFRRDVPFAHLPCVAIPDAAVHDRGCAAGGAVPEEVEDELAVELDGL